MPLNGSNASQTSYVTYVYGLPLAAVRTTVSANYSLVSTDYIVGYTSLSGPRTVTLPNAQTAGRMVIIKDETGNCSNVNTITVSGSIDGSTSKVLATPYARLRLYSNGNTWSALT